MTVYINQHYALTQQDHEGGQEWRNYVSNHSICIDISGNIFFFMSNQVISCYLDRRWQLTWLSCILRSWLHEIFIHSRTVSPWLEHSKASKYSFNHFPCPTCMPPCAENYFFFNLYICFFVLQFQGKILKSRKTMGQYTTHLENNDASKCSSASFSHIFTYFLCVENFQN